VRRFIRPHPISSVLSVLTFIIEKMGGHPFSWFSLAFKMEATDIISSILSDHDNEDTADVIIRRAAMLRGLRRELEKKDEAARERHETYPAEDTLDYRIFLAHQSYYDDYKHVNYKFILFREVCGPQSFIVEQDRSLGKGGFIWDAAFMLGEHVLKEACWQSDNVKSIVELGAGTGITGLMIAKALPNMQLQLTDLPKLLPLLEKNIMNTSNASDSVLEWGGSVTRTYDMILGADVVASIYDPSALVKTIYELAHERTWVFLAVKDRLVNTTDRFESLMKQQFAHVERTKAQSENKCPDVWVLLARGKRSYQ
jgi:predicted nicotinamide N-methyase